MERRAWTSGQWIEYFEANAQPASDIPSDGVRELSDAECFAVAASMQGFQLGESSEGRHLVDRARAWGEVNDDPAYLPAIRLFIAEEGRHARDLGRFLDLNGIPRVQKAASDSAFRFLRRSAGLELSISVLVTAEVVAQVYYAALHEATDSPTLRGLCTRILRDEAEHVRFQSERLAILAQERKPFALVLRRYGQRSLMVATLLVVWSTHHRAYRAGGYGFLRFASETWAALERALVMMDPATYGWKASTPKPLVIGGTP